MSLHDLAEIRELWGVAHSAIYRAVERGQLRAYGRPGRQKYYSEAELTALFGAPSKPRPPARQNGADATGGQQQGFELGTAAEAA